MATVVADIGGTSSRWGVLRSEGDHVIIDGLPGFNPATAAPEGFVEAVRERSRSEGLSPEALFVYSAGCGSPERADRMRDALRRIWPGVDVDLNTDLLGAARGLLEDAPGLVLILGTGMNHGRYDGRMLHQPLPSLGWILGDEGSGADIGKHIVRDALLGRVPSDVLHAVFPAGIDAASVIERLHRGTGQQAWLASFTGMLAPFARHPWVIDLVSGRFKELALLLAMAYPGPDGKHIHATGSVAYGFRDLLQAALEREGFTLGDVQRTPLPGLLHYHAARLPR